VVLAAAGLAGVLLCSCGRGTSEQILLVGSTSVQPFAEKLAHAFHAAHANIRVDVQGGGSAAGIRLVRDGAAQVGASSRHLSAAEQEGLSTFLIARDGIAVIVHRSNPVEDLAPEQIRAIFGGEITDWASLGGTSGPVHAVTREDGSGTRGAFEELVMGEETIDARCLVGSSNGTVREMVSGDPGAIGYISLGLVDERIKAVRIAGHSATHEEIVSGGYPFVRPFLFLTKGEPAGHVKIFLDYVLSPDGQAVLEKAGLARAQP